MHYSFKSTPTFSMKSRTQLITKSNQGSSIPGPGYYDVKKPLPKAGTIAQTKQKREVFKGNKELPGPGSYESKSYITTGQKRSMSARIIRQPKIVPGPQDYQTDSLKIKLKSPVYTMQSRSKSTQKIIMEHNSYKPGPFEYQTQKLNRSAGVVFGDSKRRDLTQTQKTPGPNKYMSNSHFNSVSNPRCKIGGQKRQLKIIVGENTPGPAAYQNPSFIEMSLSKKKGFSCRQKIRDLISQQLAKNPAPGQYESSTKQVFHFSPTKASRKTFIDEAKKSKQYLSHLSDSDANFLKSSKHRSSSASVFGRSTSNRKRLDQHEITPGPVAYDNDKLKVLPKQPAFSSTKQLNKNQFLIVGNPQNPGPGTYDSKIDLIKSVQKGASLMKQKRPGFQKQREKPGPGSYNISKQKQPKFAFTTQKRIAFTDKNNEAKYGTFYQLASKVVDPPSYMRVESKLKYSPPKSEMASTGF